MEKDIKNLNVETEGKSFVYLFFEDHKLSNDYKIGVTTHKKTDTSIKSWKKYLESPHPVTIERRITDLQTGSPRKIQPLAYFLYDSKKEARNVESKLHNHFEDKRSEHSKEWFNLSKEDVKFIISCLQNNSQQKIAECAQTEIVWVEDEVHWNIKQLNL
jgi:hypothetical protein